MRFIAILCALVLSTTVSVADSFTYSNNSNITVHLGEKVSSQERANILEGIRRVETYFLQETGDRFEMDVHVVAYYDDRFMRKLIPSKYRQRDCGGGFSSYDEQSAKIFAVVCLDSWPFDNARESGKLDERQMELTIHELVHVMQKQWMRDQWFENSEPHWIREADANYIGHTLRVDPNRSRESVLARMARNSDPSISLSKIRSKQSFAKYRPHSYANTAQATLWRIENFGIKAIKSYWVARGNGASYKTAFQQAYGMSLNEFYEQFEYMPQE